jgi:hypothetical protein
MKATYRDAPPFSGPEKTFELDSIIVSKTDLRGRAYGIDAYPLVLSAI